MALLNLVIALWPPAEDMALGASARVAMMHSLTHNEGLADMLGEDPSCGISASCQTTNRWQSAGRSCVLAITGPVLSDHCMYRHYQCCATRASIRAPGLADSPRGNCCFMRCTRCSICSCAPCNLSLHRMPQARCRPWAVAETCSA